MAIGLPAGSLERQVTGEAILDTSIPLKVKPVGRTHSRFHAPGCPTRCRRAIMARITSI